jgi:hypothetical protein
MPKKLYSLPELKTEYQIFRKTDPVNHAPTFKTELFEILMATINGRNDCQVVGLVPAELSCYIIRIRSGLEGKT